MKYDIYRGTEKDMEESGGVLLHKKYRKYHVFSFCKRHGIDEAAFLNGDYVTDENGFGYWLEESRGVGAYYPANP